MKVNMDSPGFLSLKESWVYEVMNQGRPLADAMMVLYGGILAS